MANTNRDQINSAMGGSQDPNQDDYQQAMGGGQYVPGGAPTPTPTPTLNALSASPTAGTVGAPYSGIISGNTGGSTLSLSGVGATGLSLAGTAITGTPTVAGAVNVIETLAGATNSPRTSSALITVLAAASAISTPTLTKTSASGLNPIAFTIGIPDNTIVVGYYWRLQVASNSGFTTDLRDETRLITSDDFPADGSSSGNAAFASLTNMIDGPTYVRLRVERDDGAVSGWSNVIMDTLSSVPVNVTFDPTTKNNFATLSNNNLTLTGNNGVNANQSAKSTASKLAGTGANSKGWVENLCGTSAADSLGGRRTFGLVPASVITSGNNFVIVGREGVPGVTWHSDGTVYDNEATYSIDGYTDGDRLGLYYDAGATAGSGKVWFWKNGAWTTATGDPFATTPGAGLPVTNTVAMFIIAGAYLNNPVTLAFKPADQTGRGTKQAWGS